MNAKLRLLPHALLATTVAGPAAVLSFDSVRQAAEPHFGHLAWLAPLMADGGAAGFALWYVTTVRSGRAQHALRLASHVCVGITVTLNVLSAHSPVGALWHAVPPVLWSVLVELYARHFADEWKAAHLDVAKIPLRLWITSPIESFRTWLVQARKVADPGSRAQVGAHDAARLVLDLAAGSRVSTRRAHQLAVRQLTTGAVSPAQVLGSAQLDPAQLSPAQALALRLAAHSAQLGSAHESAQLTMAAPARLTAHGSAHEPAHEPAQRAAAATPEPAQLTAQLRESARGSAQLGSAQPGSLGSARLGSLGSAHSARRSARVERLRAALAAEPGANGPRLSEITGIPVSSVNKLRKAM